MVISGSGIFALALLLLLIAFGLVAATVLRQDRPEYTVDLAAEQLGQPFNLVGFYAAERNEGYGYRWTQPWAMLQIPWAYHSAPAYEVALRLRDASPTSRPLTLLANEIPLATFTPGNEFRTYHMLLPAPANEAELRLALRIPPFVAEGDTRPLGVLLTNLTIKGAPHTDWPALLVIFFGSGLFWGWLRLSGERLWPATLVAGVFGLGLVGMFASYSPAPLNYPTIAAVALGGAMVATSISRPTTARLALALLALLVSFAGVLWPPWLSDDAFISFRYAQNLAGGNGLVYNIGERVEGYTNFLWTMIAAGVIRSGSDIIWFAYFSGTIIAVVLVLATYHLACMLSLLDGADKGTRGHGAIPGLPAHPLTGSPPHALVAALIVATHQGVLLYTSRGAGLETGFFALLVLLGVTAYLKGISLINSGYSLFTIHYSFAGLIFALASMTRPEGVLITGLTAAHLAWHNFIERKAQSTKNSKHSFLFSVLRSLFSMLLPYLLIFLPYFLWRMNYYGDLLPNTFYAKTGGGLRQVERGLAYAGAFALTLGGPLLLLIAVPPRQGWWALMRGWRSYLLLVVGTYTAYIIAVGGDHFRGERFFVPLVPLFAVLVAAGLREVYRALSTQHSALVTGLASLTIALLLALGSGVALSRTAPYDYIIRGLDESVWIWREIGWWMADNTPPEASIAATGAGAIAYYSERTTIDLYGLTDKHIARVENPNMGEGVAGHEKSDPAYVLNERKPTYIPQMWEDYFGGPDALAGNYKLITITTRYGREVAMWKRSAQE
jgi:arabinofuranosyltransferase